MLLWTNLGTLGLIEIDVFIKVIFAITLFLVLVTMLVVYIKEKIQQDLYLTGSHCSERSKTKSK